MNMSLPPQLMESIKLNWRFPLHLLALRPQTLALIPLNPSLPLFTASLLLLVQKPETWTSLLTLAFLYPQMKKLQYFSLYMKNIYSFLEGL